MLKFDCKLTNSSKSSNLSAKFKNGLCWNLCAKYDIDLNVPIWNQNMELFKIWKLQFKISNWSKCWNFNVKWQFHQNVQIWVQNLKMSKMLKSVCKIWYWLKYCNLKPKYGINMGNSSSKYDINQNVETSLENIKSIKMLKFLCKMTNSSKCSNLSAKYEIDQKCGNLIAKYQIKMLQFHCKWQICQNFQIWVQNLKICKMLKLKSVCKIWNKSKCCNLNPKIVIKMWKLLFKITNQSKCWKFHVKWLFYQNVQIWVQNLKTSKMLKSVCKI